MVYLVLLAKATKMSYQTKQLNKQKFYFIRKNSKNIFIKTKIHMIAIDT